MGVLHHVLFVLQKRFSAVPETLKNTPKKHLFHREPEVCEAGSVDATV